MLKNKIELTKDQILQGYEQLYAGEGKTAHFWYNRFIYRIELKYKDRPGEIIFKSFEYYKDALDFLKSYKMKATENNIFLNKLNF